MLRLGEAKSTTQNEKNNYEKIFFHQNDLVNVSNLPL
jgi:hypothetical protein